LVRSSFHGLESVPDLGPSIPSLGADIHFAFLFSAVVMAMGGLSGWLTSLVTRCGPQRFWQDVFIAWSGYWIVFFMCDGHPFDTSPSNCRATPLLRHLFSCRSCMSCIVSSERAISAIIRKSEALSVSRHACQGEVPTPLSKKASSALPDLTNPGLPASRFEPATARHCTASVATLLALSRRDAWVLALAQIQCCATGRTVTLPALARAAIVSPCVLARSQSAGAFRANRRVVIFPGACASFAHSCQFFPSQSARSLRPRAMRDRGRCRAAARAGESPCSPKSGRTSARSPRPQSSGRDEEPTSQRLYEHCLSHSPSTP
jgi:hypothetical protein